MEYGCGFEFDPGAGRQMSADARQRGQPPAPTGYGRSRADATRPRIRSSPSSYGPGAWPGNRRSPRDATASQSPPPCPSSSGRSTLSGNGIRSWWTWDVGPSRQRGGHRYSGDGLPCRSMCDALFCCPETSRRRRSYWPGPLTVSSRRFDSGCPPSFVQMAPVVSQSVVTGRTTVTSALESGSTVIRQ